MIGGHDMVLDGAGPSDEGVVIVSELRRVWPELVVQDAEAGEAVAPAGPSIERMIERMTEFFVYRSRADFESWMARGATEANADTMVHVILGEASTTLVTDRSPSESLRLQPRHGGRSGSPVARGESAGERLASWLQTARQRALDGPARPRSR